MKNQLLLLLFLLIGITAKADLKALETIEVSSDLVGINFEDDNESLVLTFNDTIKEPMHCVIDISRISDLEYKTRVMRYFGGLLVNNTYDFKNLVIIVDGKRMVYNWNRDNVSTVVNKMCRQAESLS